MDTGAGESVGRRWDPFACGRWDLVLAVGAVLVGCLLVFHGAVPNGFGRLGSLLETFLPWLGLAVPALTLLALWRRSVVALFAVLLPAAAWAGQFAQLLYVPPASGSAYDITVVQHNVSDENPDPAAAARALRAADADVIALEELTSAALPLYEGVLAAQYPHHAVIGTVGVWSKHPLREVRPVDIRPSGVGAGWNRGLRATATTPEGEVALYVAHLPSIRLSPTQGLASARRDECPAARGGPGGRAARPGDRAR